MTYATQQDMLNRFGQSEVVALTDRANLGTIDAAMLDGALAEAVAEIEPYLAPRYKLPLATVPKIITGFACDIARYRLCGSGVTVTDDIRDRYKDAIRFFEQVTKGVIGLGLDAANAPAQSANTVQFSETSGRVFARDVRG